MSIVSIGKHVVVFKLESRIHIFCCKRMRDLALCEVSCGLHLDLIFLHSFYSNNAKNHIKLKMKAKTCHTKILLTLHGCTDLDPVRKMHDYQEETKILKILPMYPLWTLYFRVTHNYTNFFDQAYFHTNCAPR